MEPFSGFHLGMNFVVNSRGSKNGDFCARVNSKQIHFAAFLRFLPFGDEFPGEF